MEKKRWDRLFLVIVGVATAVFLLLSAYIAWDTATTKAYGSFDCEVRQIDYVRLQGNGSCVFPLVQGDESWCALPRDVRCSGAVGDFPLVKALVKLRRDG
jgi:hypothetical protein